VGGGGVSAARLFLDLLLGPLCLALAAVERLLQAVADVHGSDDAHQMNS
jgi:hypothetical protein